MVENISLKKIYIHKKMLKMTTQKNKKELFRFLTFKTNPNILVFKLSEQSL